MPLTISLPPALEARLNDEAARVGMPPAALVEDVLDAHLPADRRAAALALLDSWRTGADAQEQREAGEELILGLNATRSEAGERLHFPPELKGITW